MKTLTISPRFFAIEKKNYTDWKFAFWRELFQNSLDAGAGKIECLITESGENHSIIQFNDDGKGMSQKVLEDVFLTMGETSKLDGETKGGYGKARNLTCFSADYYKIISQDYICEGIGANYEIKKGKQFVRGVKFEAKIEATKDELIERFKQIVYLSRINSIVILNGENLNDSYRMGTFCREMDCGFVYANKSNEKIKNKLIVRVDGLVTFVHYTAAKAGVTVEIHLKNSRDILSATRDNLNYKYKTQLDEFLGELAADTTSALKDRSRRFIKYINKSKAFVSRIKEILSSGKEVSINQIIPANLIPAAQTAIVKQIINSSPDSSYSGGDVGLGSRVLPLSQEYLTKSTCPILDSMVIYSDTNNENIKKVIKFYDPTENNGTIGADRHKFIKQWKSICEIIGEELSNLTKTEYLWAVGWVFDDDAIAMHMKNEGVSYVMINPVNNEGKLKYSLNNKKDLTRLTVSACHEFVHVAGFNLHNQDFVIYYDALLERVMPRIKDVFQACADAKNS
ncbi:ATP-binding protein [Flavobacterium sp.]|uniref:ATP-binding protein n=1 Tax=Flavobacterium sp. TaxID=239 RepID=UPI0038FC2F3C